MNEGGGFAASIYEAMPESSIQVTSHLRLLIPSYSSLATHPCFQTSEFRVVVAASPQVYRRCPLAVFLPVSIEKAAE